MFQLIPKYQSKVKLISDISVRNIRIAKKWKSRCVFLSGFQGLTYCARCHTHISFFRNIVQIHVNHFMLPAYSGQIMNWILSAFILPLSLSLAVSNGRRGIHICINFTFFLRHNITKNFIRGNTHYIKKLKCFGLWKWRKCCRQSRGLGLVVEKHIKISTGPEMERTTQISLLMRHEWSLLCSNLRFLWEN